MSSNHDRVYVATMMLCEAESEGREAMLWCLWAIYNRTQDTRNRWPKKLSAAITQRMQLSEFNDDRADNANLLRVLELDDYSPQWQLAYEIYDEWNLPTGHGPDPTNGSTHFYSTGITPPAWTAPPAVFRGQQGKVRFYSNVN